MTTWRDGGDYGRLSGEITDESGSHAICRVWTKRNAEHRGGGIDGSGTEPYLAGEANFRLILNAPRMLEALEAIRDQAECYLQPLTGPSVSRARWEAVRDRTVAAIAAVKGEDDGLGD